MNNFLGIDTSNYTTSVAYFENGVVKQTKRLLPVEFGRLGLRQSDAVFHHVQGLPEVFKDLTVGKSLTINAIGVSAFPRDQRKSYMPCFTVGVSAANILGNFFNIPVYKFSHQAGHIAAGLYSVGKIALLNEPFVAFHVSGGTTEAVLLKPDKDKVISSEIIAKTLDLKAGQLIDRVGLMLGTSFPAGKELEALARNCIDNIEIKTCLKGEDACFSGIQNICENMKRKSEKNEKIARTCIEDISQTLEKMYNAVIKKYGEMPTLFVGGVMSNSIIRQNFEKKYDVIFAKPEYSSDNAVGVSVLAAIKAGYYGRN